MDGPRTRISVGSRCQSPRAEDGWSRAYFTCGHTDAWSRGGRHAPDPVAAEVVQAREDGGLGGSVQRFLTALRPPNSAR